MKILTAILLALTGWLYLTQTLTAADGGVFTDASLDTSQAHFVEGERYCPMPTRWSLSRGEILPYYGIRCSVALVEGKRPAVRSDYGRAMYACWLLAEYDLNECDESVREGEF